jgi:LysM repeat protein
MRAALEAVEELKTAARKESEENQFNKTLHMMSQASRHVPQSDIAARGRAAFEAHMKANNPQMLQPELMGAETTEVLTENLMFPSFPLNQAPLSPPAPVEPPEPPVPQDPSAPFIGYATEQLSHEPQKKSKKKVAVLLSAAAAALAMAAAIIFFFVLPGTEPGDDTQLTKAPVTGYGISVNNKTEIYLASQEEAQGVLTSLKAHYTNKVAAEGNDVTSVDYEEEVIIIVEEVPDSDIMQHQEALQALINGKTQTITHTVEPDETLETIAKHYNITTDSIIAGNQGLTLEGKLAEATPLSVVVTEPYLNVIIAGTYEITEEIDFTAEVKKDSARWLYTSEVTQEGEKGSKVIRYSYTTKNGNITHRTTQSESITKPPVNKITHEGTNPYSLDLKNKGITNATLASRIESGEIPSYTAVLNLSINTELSNITSLGKLTGLTTLDLSFTDVSDIETLKNLKNLKSLNLKNSSVPAGKKAELEDALKGCTITF